MLKFYAAHHNKIQFFGYEVANIVWILSLIYAERIIGYGLNIETGAALAFLIGSALIWAFDPENRPQMLFFGGFVLAWGGLCLMAAGFVITGLAVVVAALETARGGLHVLQESIAFKARHKDGKQLSHHLTLRFAHYALGWYQKPVHALATRFPHVGRFINERPFITGTLIKAPLRLEFIAKKMLVGDWIGAGVGLSWMLLGDVALAFNDSNLQSSVAHSSHRNETLPAQREDIPGTILSRI